jgi:hypothetical protein
MAPPVTMEKGSTRATLESQLMNRCGDNLRMERTSADIRSLSWLGLRTECVVWILQQQLLPVLFSEQSASRKHAKLLADLSVRFGRKDNMDVVPEIFAES